MFTMMLESSDIKNWNEIYEKLKSYSDDAGIPISKILDKAISLYLDSVKDKA